MGLRLEAHARGGDQVLVAESVALRFGERTLVEDFSTRVLRGEVIGLIGPNGAGKSTLLRGIAGQQQLSEGELRLGLSTQLAALGACLALGHPRAYLVVLSICTVVVIALVANQSRRSST